MNKPLIVMLLSGTILTRHYLMFFLHRYRHKFRFRENSISVHTTTIAIYYALCFLSCLMLFYVINLLYL